MGETIEFLHAFECDKAENSADDESAETLFFADVTTALKAAAPEGSTVRAIGFDDTNGFLRAGYRLTDEPADVCIARGGEAEFASARKTTYKKLILVPTHSYCASACGVYRTQTKSFAVMRRCEKPFAAVFDPAQADDNLASLYGEIVALDVAAFDVKFGACMRGERANASAANEIAKLITELTAELKAKEKNVTAQKRALTNAGMRAAQTLAKFPELLHSSGAAQATEAYRMLCAAENRKAHMRGETEMIFCAYIIDFYIKCLSTFKSDFPPDNNRRIDRLCEYMGADVRYACVHLAPLFAPQKLRLYEYRVKEFRAEWLSLLAEISKRRAAAWQVFKRLYPDDGYGIKSIVDKTDVPLCVALAPDVFRADSLLSYFKQAGKLEKYIV